MNLVIANRRIDPKDLDYAEQDGWRLVSSEVRAGAIISVHLHKDTSWQAATKPMWERLGYDQLEFMIDSYGYTLENIREKVKDEGSRRLYEARLKHREAKKAALQRLGIPT